MSGIEAGAYKYVIFNGEGEVVAVSDDKAQARHAALTFARQDKQGQYVVTETKRILVAKYCHPCHTAKAELVQ